MAFRAFKARYAGKCSSCTNPVAAKEPAWWDGDTKTLLCENCGQQQGLVKPAAKQNAANKTAEATDTAAADKALDTSNAGASAQREHDRRSMKREKQVRAAHPHIGGLILALTDDPQSTKAWAVGAVGERKLAMRLNELSQHGCIVLHDRRIPGTRANIDHLVVAASGLWIVDAKRYTGRIGAKDVGGFFKKDVRLYVGTRDCSKLVAGLEPQIQAVVKALESHGVAIPIQGCLCFVDGDWGLFAKPFTIDQAYVAWPKAIVETIRQPGPLTAEQVQAIGVQLAHRLKPS